MLKIKTIYGDISGEKEYSYSSFKGIPYAKPPVGELRFRPPVKPEAWEGVKDGTAYGAPALQLFTSAHVTQPQILRTSSEDCLYLNVKTPAPVVGEGDNQTIDSSAKLPVYIFVHGGAYETGGSNLPLYAGENFARKGIVYVNINYRLGVFASMSLETLEKESGVTGNYQLLDIIKALEWVHENIAVFGGDPDCVTLGGESAGAFSVSAIMQIPATKHLYKRCILESGSIIGTSMSSKFGHGNPEKMINDCQNFVNELGASDSDEGLRLLRSIPAEELAKKWFFKEDGTFRGIKSDPMLRGLLFDKDLMPDPRTQNVNDVDLLFGFNTDEGTMFANPYITEKGYEEFIRDSFISGASEVLKRYPVNAEHSAYERTAEVIGLQSFKGSMLPYADVLSDRGKSVYGYNFDYLTETLAAEGLGCRHIAELNFVFGKFLNLVGADDVQGRAISELMNEAWAQFIKTGNPNSPDSAVPQWKPYSSVENNMLKINASPENVRAPRLEDMRFFEEIMKEND